MQSHYSLKKKWMSFETEMVRFQCDGCRKFAFKFFRCISMDFLSIVRLFSNDFWFKHLFFSFTFKFCSFWLLTEFLQINGLLFFATEILTVDFWRLQKIQMLTMDLMCRYTNYQCTKQHFFYIYQAIPKFRCLFDFTRIFVCLFVRLLVYFIT